MGKPTLFITEDATTGKALVRGADAEQATRMCAQSERRWSWESRGWIIPLELVSDVQVFAAYYHLLAVTTKLKRPPKRGAA